MWDLTIHPIWGPASSLALIPFSNRCGTSTKSTPLRASVSLLTHRSVSGSDTICNNSSPPLADIVLFGLPLKVFKTCQFGRGFHTLINDVSFSSRPVWDLTGTKGEYLMENELQSIIFFAKLHQYSSNICQADVRLAYLPIKLGTVNFQSNFWKAFFICSLKGKYCAPFFH